MPGTLLHSAPFALAALLILAGCSTTPRSPVSGALLACIERIEAGAPEDCAVPLAAQYEATESAEDRDRIDRLLAAAAAERRDLETVFFHLERRYRSGHDAALRPSDLEILAKAAAVTGATSVCIEVLEHLGQEPGSLTPAGAWRLAHIARACPDLERALAFAELAIARASRPVPAWLKERARFVRELGRYRENARLERDLARLFPADALGGSTAFSERWSTEIERSANDADVVPDLEARCAMATLAACEVLAYLRIEGALADRDHAAGIEGFDTACSDGAAGACQWLATRRAERDESAEERSETLALFDRACEAGSQMACMERGNAYETGLGGAVDLDSAQRLYAKTCRAGLIGGCNALFHLADARGLLSSEVREDVEAGCRRRHRVSCSLLATDAMERRRSWPVVEPFVAASCALGQLSHCGLLGVAYELGTDTPRDLRRALEYYQHACMAGHARSCTRIGPVEALLYSEELNQRP